MNPYSRFVPVLGLVAVSAVAVLDGARPVAQAAPGPQDTVIVNPATNPARTTVIGPVTASIANTPAEAVPVAVQGMPSVSVAGPVTLAGTPSVAVSGAVTVGNDGTQPVPVREVASPPVAWVGGGQLIIDPGESYESEQFYTAPPGKRLVLEAVSFEASLPTGQVATFGTVLASAGGDGEIFRFPIPPAPKETPAFDKFLTFQSTKINVGAGLVVAVSRNATAGLGIVNVALSGYVVDDQR